MAIGTDAQKKEIIGPMLRNEVIWCQGFSEPGAGSDLAALRTRGVRDGDDCVVNGQKIWTTSAVHGDRIFTLVRTDPDAAQAQGHLDAAHRHDQPGVEVRPIKQMTAASEFGEVFFTDARVPAAEVPRRRSATAGAPRCCCSPSSAARPAIGQYTEFRRQYDEIVGRRAARSAAATDPVCATGWPASSSTWSACGCTRCTCSPRSSRAATWGSRRR